MLDSTGDRLISSLEYVTGVQPVDAPLAFEFPFVDWNGPTHSPYATVLNGWDPLATLNLLRSSGASRIINGRLIFDTPRLPCTDNAIPDALAQATSGPCAFDPVLDTVSYRSSRAHHRERVRRAGSPSLIVRRARFAGFMDRGRSKVRNPRPRPRDVANHLVRRRLSPQLMYTEQVTFVRDPALDLAASSDNLEICPQICTELVACGPVVFNHSLITARLSTVPLDNPGRYMCRYLRRICNYQRYSCVDLFARVVDVVRVFFLTKNLFRFCCYHLSGCDYASLLSFARVTDVVRVFFLTKNLFRFCCYHLSGCDYTSLLSLLIGMHIHSLIIRLLLYFYNIRKFFNYERMTSRNPTFCCYRISFSSYFLMCVLNIPTFVMVVHPGELQYDSLRTRIFNLRDSLNETRSLGVNTQYTPSPVSFGSGVIQPVSIRQGVFDALVRIKRTSDPQQIRGLHASTLVNCADVLNRTLFVSVVREVVMEAARTGDTAHLSQLLQLIAGATAHDVRTQLHSIISDIEKYHGSTTVMLLNLNDTFTRFAETILPHRCPDHPYPSTDYEALVKSVESTVSASIVRELRHWIQGVKPDQLLNVAVRARQLYDGNFADFTIPRTEYTFTPRLLRNLGVFTLSAFDHGWHRAGSSDVLITTQDMSITEYDHLHSGVQTIRVSPPIIILDASRMFLWHTSNCPLQMNGPHLVHSPVNGQGKVFVCIPFLPITHGGPAYIYYYADAFRSTANHYEFTHYDSYNSDLGLLCRGRWCQPLYRHCIMSIASSNNLRLPRDYIFTVESDHVLLSYMSGPECQLRSFNIRAPVDMSREFLFATLPYVLITDNHHAAMLSYQVRHVCNDLPITAQFDARDYREPTSYIGLRGTLADIVSLRCSNLIELRNSIQWMAISFPRHSDATLAQLPALHMSIPESMRPIFGFGAGLFGLDLPEIFNNMVNFIHVIIHGDQRSDQPQPQPGPNPDLPWYARIFEPLLAFISGLITSVKNWIIGRYHYVIAFLPNDVVDFPSALRWFVTLLLYASGVFVDVLWDVLEPSASVVLYRLVDSLCYIRPDWPDLILAILIITLTVHLQVRSTYVTVVTAIMAGFIFLLLKSPSAALLPVC